MVLQTILIQLLYHIPFFIIWLIGIILAATRWQKHPRLSLLALIIFLLLFITQIIVAAVDIALPEIAYQTGGNFTLVSYIVSGIDLILNVPLWALIVWAIFGWRKPATSEGAYPAQPQLWGQPPVQSWQAPQPGQARLSSQTPPESTPPPNQG